MLCDLLAAKDEEHRMAERRKNTYNHGRHMELQYINKRG
jgi:hypothetical protein